MPVPRPPLAISASMRSVMENGWKQIFWTLKKSMASLSCRSNMFELVKDAKCSSQVPTHHLFSCAGVKHHVKRVAKWASKQVQAIKQPFPNQLREVNKDSNLVLATSGQHVLEVHKTPQSKYIIFLRASWNKNLQNEISWISKLLQHPGFPFQTWVLSCRRHGLLFLILSCPAAQK